MFQRMAILLISAFLLVSCGGASPASTEPAVSASPAFLVENTPVPTPTLTAVLPTLSPSPTLSPTVTPTETPLPPLELPTEIPNAPNLLPWDGVPTYLGDSQPGYVFRVLYNPETWALTEDQFGFPALAHRAIPYCVISVTAGRGLPLNLTVEQDILYTSTLTFYISTAYENGVKKFVTYTGGDGKILTAFQVSFEEQADQCLADAETVLTTLRSVASFQATPTP